MPLHLWSRYLPPIIRNPLTPGNERQSCLQMRSRDAVSKGRVQDDTPASVSEIRTLRRGGLVIRAVRDPHGSVRIRTDSSDTEHAAETETTTGDHIVCKDTMKGDDD